MSVYTVDIQTTGGDYPPDAPVPLGMGCASSTVWCRVTRDDESTGWVECRKMPSIIKARAGFNAALATYGDVGEDVGAMFEAVTGVAMVLS